jgi:hypothetical protein
LGMFGGNSRAMCFSYKICYSILVRAFIENPISANMRNY